MRVIGKVVGGVVGFVVARNPLGMVVGAVVGHAFDAGWIALPGGSAEPAAPEDPYETLGVPADATQAQIDKAYRQLMAKYHPDRVANASDDIRETAEQRTRAVNAAYDLIRKQRRR